MKQLVNRWRGQTSLAAALAVLFAAVALLGAASAQAPMKMKGSAGMVRGHKMMTSRGANPNIKQDEMKANPASDRAAAKAKGARGGNLHFDNHTNLYIRCYVDGDYVGSMGPGGDLFDYEGGVHTMYCIALFDDGSSRTWGPVAVYAPYHLNLYP